MGLLENADSATTQETDLTLSVQAHALLASMPVEASPVVPVFPESRLASAPVQVAELQALIGDDAQLIGEFLAAFRVSGADIAADFELAFGASELGAAGAAAHKLKFAARSVGALKLCGLGEQIERAAEDRDAEAALIPHFTNEIRDVDEYLAAWLPAKSEDDTAARGQVA
jgi:two-component system sensor histidine kinase/response regulator